MKSTTRATAKLRTRTTKIAMAMETARRTTTRKMPFLTLSLYVPVAIDAGLAKQNAMAEDPVGIVPPNT
jgi:hypothetical protein